jgi:flagellin
MKLSAAIRRTEATQANVNNSMAFLETQDGVLKSADKLVSRMSELAQLANDVTKSTSDLALYQTEVNTLKSQLSSMMSETFNGVSLFSSGTSTTPATASTLSVVASQDGSQTIGITQADLLSVGRYVGTTSSLGIDISSATGAKAAISTVTAAIQNLAQLRAYNGAEQSRLNFASDTLSINKTNLEAANSRIIDVDVAEESSKLARFNILQQAGTAMLAQANQSTQSLLRLLS